MRHMCKRTTLHIMTNDDKIKDSEQFVARHYREGVFSKRAAWQRLGIPAMHRWNITRGIAAAAILGVITASACLYLFDRPQSEPQEAKSIEIEMPTESVPAALSAADTPQTLEFDNAPLSEVVDKIETTYKVKIENVPTDDYRLTLRYTGTAKELVETINELLNINLVISE